MSKTIAEINAKIRSGKAIVLTAEEIIDVVQTKGAKQAAQEVDVVTTGTFSPMCSSGAFLNLKQPKDKMKIGGGFATLNGVPAYAGLAAADIYIGATAIPDGDSRNNNGLPGKFRYGGAHVIEDLISGKEVLLKAGAYGTDCYPRKDREQLVGLDDMNDAFLFNPRNCYQNYNVAVNLSDRPIYTYMGKLKPKLGNAHCEYFKEADNLAFSGTSDLRRVSEIVSKKDWNYVAQKKEKHNSSVVRASKFWTLSEQLLKVGQGFIPALCFFQ